MSNASQQSENPETLLDAYLNQEDSLLVQKTQMGSTEAYIGSVSLAWLDKRVGFAAELPLFRQKFDSETGDVVRDAETIDEIQQRPLDWSRQAPLTQYLVTRDTRKFPAVLVVVSPSWVDDPYAKEWGLNGRAKSSAIAFSPLDTAGKVGLLNLSSSVSIFALDGQHRLMSVQGLITLLNTGKLPCYNKYKTLTGAVITLEDLAKEYAVNASSLQELANEQIGIEFIPAVMAGETREEARRRVRSIFVHVNLMAVKLSRGQLALLDEDNGFAIIARKVAVTHPLLAEKEGRNSRVNWDSATVATKSTVLTTLQALQDMAERFLIHKFPHWKPTDVRNLLPMRPTEEELEEGLADFEQLWHSLASLPTYQRLQQEDTPKLRRFSHEKGSGEANLLFRPVGQIAVAQALGYLIYKKGFSPTDIFARLRYFDQKGGFSGIEYSDSLWYGILYDPIKKRIQVAGRELAAKLLIYLLGGVSDTFEQAQIRQAFAEARTIGDKTISFEGKFVEPRKVTLPPVIKTLT